MRISVIGATGTAGSRTVAKLAQHGHEPVEISRSRGVDLISGHGLREKLAGVDVAIDTSNAFPSGGGMDLQDALTSATRNVVEACAAQDVGHLVFLSICGIEKPVFDEFPYYLAKRAQEEIVSEAALRSTTVKSSQWHEFATNPAAVTFHDDYVEVEDWLIQPVAADAGADVLVEAAIGPAQARTRTITGPEAIRLPELTTRLLERRGDRRAVRAIAPALAELAEGVLLAPEDAEIIGPDVETWLRTAGSAVDHAGRAIATVSLRR
jgi:uncharacterized protein YbjT (DUF2867 family)